MKNLSKNQNYFFLLINILSIALLFVQINSHASCVHDEMIQKTEKHYYNDLFQKRLLQTTTIGPLRIFADYSQVVVGSSSQINIIKRIVSITSSYFYKTLKVVRLNKLFFPTNVSTTCNVLTVPAKYRTEGVDGDVGFIVGNENVASASYTAKSAACAFLQSDKRSIWGVMIFNNAFLKFDQYGFQQILFVGMHQATHILGFSAQMYPTYPTGNPLKNIATAGVSDYYLDSPALRRQLTNHFNCAGNGLLLEDQDGTLIGSHIQRKIIGNQFMIATGKKHSFVSRLTLAVLQTTGWYPQVNYAMAEPTTWGRQKGCTFFNIDDCNSRQFCQGSSFDCEWDYTSIGKCNPDAFTGSCQTVRYYTNTICIDQNFQLRNLNAPLNAAQRGGQYSRCFFSNLRQIGKNATMLNNRCYVSVCSSNNQYVFILVGTYVLICRVPGQVLLAPAGMQGTITCPTDFSNMCQNKKTCAYHCNKNGACINGQCLCTGQTQFSSTCLDISLSTAQIGSTGGFNFTGGVDVLYSKSDGTTLLVQKKCFTGYVYDFSFGQCQKCQVVYNCKNCNQAGCISCDNGVTIPINGKC